MLHLALLSANWDTVSCVVQAFRGNDDGNTVVVTRFETEIIARYLRINPTRWRDRISMRLEVYGCEYGE